MWVCVMAVASMHRSACFGFGFLTTAAGGAARSHTVPALAVAAVAIQRVRALLLIAPHHTPCQLPLEWQCWGWWVGSALTGDAAVMGRRRRTVPELSRGRGRWADEIGTQWIALETSPSSCTSTMRPTITSINNTNTTTAITSTMTTFTGAHSTRAQSVLITAIPAAVVMPTHLPTLLVIRTKMHIDRAWGEIVLASSGPVRRILRWIGRGMGLPISRPGEQRWCWGLMYLHTDLAHIKVVGRSCRIRGGGPGRAGILNEARLRQR